MARRIRIPFLFATALLLAAQSASALVTVCPSGCSSTSIQGAINTVLDNERHGSADPFIAVASVKSNGAAATYNEVLTVDGSNITSYDVFGTHYDHPFVQIYGDYNTAVNAENHFAATVSASGKGGNSVLLITGNVPVTVILNYLNLINASGVGAGGGIDFTGSGSLDLSNVDINNNRADFGGGIYAQGNGAEGITLALHSGTFVQTNFANEAGGGIRIQGNTYLMALEPQTWIFNNQADPNNAVNGVGGGLQVLNDAAVADIGSPGFSGSPVIEGNHARRGAGIAVRDHGGLRLFSTIASSPARVEGNIASQDGGGIFLDGGAFLCASGYGINGNTAVNGAAIFVDGGTSSDVHLTSDQLLFSNANAGVGCGKGHALPPAAACVQGGSCNTINDNTGGQAIIVGTSSNFIARRLELRRNNTPFLLYMLGTAKFGDCLMAGNTGLTSVIEAFGSNLEINGCTLAGNALGAVDPMIQLDNASGVLSIENSILNDTANHITMSVAAGTLNVTDVLASETASLSTATVSTNVNSYDPKFVDPASGNYHLKPESPAVDYHLSTTPAFFNPPNDLDGIARSVNLLHLVRANATPSDIGAYELLSLGDLIFVDGLDGIR